MEEGSYQAGGEEAGSQVAVTAIRSIPADNIHSCTPPSALEDIPVQYLLSYFLSTPHNFLLRFPGLPDLLSGVSSAAHNISSRPLDRRLSSEFSSSTFFLPSPHLSTHSPPTPPPPFPRLLLTFLPICHLLLPLLTPLPSSLPFPHHRSSPRQAQPLPRPVLLQPIEEGSQSMTGQIYNSDAP